MKRIAGWLLCICLALSILPAMADGLSEVMCVTNCNEWVSLREDMDTKSKRLEKVHLGELVTHCKMAYDGFIECEFNGKVGYIQSKYLKETAFTSYESFPGNQMVVNVTDWASMWEYADSSSARVAKVPVGTIVTSCVRISDSYIYCEYTTGKKVYQGFISRSCLKAANYSASTKNSKVSTINPAINGIPMTVVNCESWVSLREKASTSAARLARVPLGTQVDECIQVSDDFIYCRYHGLYGYIQFQYLSSPYVTAPPAVITAPPAVITAAPAVTPAAIPVVPSEAEPASSFNGLPVLPDYATFMDFGHPVMQETYKGYTILTRRVYNDFEEMLAVCYDLNNVPLWRLYAQSLSEVSDVTQLDAFVAGSIADPQLIWYVSGVGFYSYSYGPALQLRWFLPDSLGPNITDSIIHTVDYDGSFYVAFSNVLMHISANGQMLWRVSSNDSALFWPVSIEVNETGVSVLYDNHFGMTNTYGEARFGPDGTFQYITERNIPAGV